MKLSYRGIQYHKNISSLLIQKTNVIAKYRGISYQISSDNKKIEQPNHLLKYRGIPYESNPNQNNQKMLNGHYLVTSSLSQTQLSA